MTSREIIKANLEHSRPERPGLDFHSNPDMRGDFVGGGPGDPVGYEPKRWVEGEREFYDDIWGNVWSRMREGCAVGEIHKAALEDWNQLDKFRPPRFDRALCVASYRQGFAAAPDKFRLAWIGGWVFASSRYLRKMENYLMDLALYPVEVKRLHELVAGVFRLQIAAAGDAGADGIAFCEDMGTQNGLLMSPAMWQDYFGELYAELFGLAHERGLKVLMHSCGKNDEILDPLLQAGVDCFQFDQPTIYDPAWLQGLLARHRAALWSPVDIQKILPTGDRSLIERGVDAMFAHHSGNLILKEYPDLKGIGVKEEWNRWAYERVIANIRATGATV